jgi:hypothetical protein
MPTHSARIRIETILTVQARRLLGRYEAEPGGEGVHDRQIATGRCAGYEAVPVLKAGS